MSLSHELRELLTDSMCIEIQDLIEKIQTLESPKWRSDIYSMLENFFVVLNGEGAKDEILKIFQSYEHLSNNDHAHEIIDPLRHAFTSFACGGLHQLFTRQENEAWYPKIVLAKELEPNDIATLAHVVEIYRGCGMSEHDSGSYGQSWTTSKNIAMNFAYSHYQNQPWFNGANRVVLKSKIPRSAIFYSDQNCEFEVVVDVSFLDAVHVYA